MAVNIYGPSVLPGARDLMAPEAVGGSSAPPPPLMPDAAPPAGGSAPPQPLGQAPLTLPLPLADLPLQVEIESLLKLIGEESRKEMMNATIATIKAKGQIKQSNLQDQIKKLEEQMKKNNTPWNTAKKILGWIGAALAVVVAAAVTVSTGGAGGVAMVGALLLLGTAVAGLGTQIASEATKGDYFPGKGISLLLQKCGVDEKTADLAGSITAGVLMLASSIAGSVMSGGAAGADTAAKIAKIVKTISCIAQSLTAVAGGTASIVVAVNDYQSSMAGVDLKKLQAALQRIDALINQEEEFLRTMMEEGQNIVSTVEKILNGLRDTLQSSLAGPAAAPSMA